MLLCYTKKEKKKAASMDIAISVIFQFIMQPYAPLNYSENSKTDILYFLSLNMNIITLTVELNQVL